MVDVINETATDLPDIDIPKELTISHHISQGFLMEQIIPSRRWGGLCDRPQHPEAGHRTAGSFSAGLGKLYQHRPDPKQFQQMVFLRYCNVCLARTWPVIRGRQRGHAWTHRPAQGLGGTVPHICRGFRLSNLVGSSNLGHKDVKMFNRCRIRPILKSSRQDRQVWRPNSFFSPHPLFSVLFSE